MELVVDAHTIARKARLIFSGIYVEDDGLGNEDWFARLPWSSSFANGGDNPPRMASLDADFATISDWLFNTMSERTRYSQGPRIHCDLPFFDKERAVRAASVEAMVAADRTIGNLFEDELPEALSNLSCAYQCLAECQARARALFRLSLNCNEES